MVDIDNAIDVWLFVNLTVARDNVWKNMSYIAKWNGAKYIMLFSPWDLDHTWYGWGNTRFVEKPVEPAPPGLLFESEIPAARALSLNLGDTRKRARLRYFALRKTILSDEHVAKMFANYEAKIYGSGAIRRDHEKWPIAGYTGNMIAFKEFVMRRIAFMDKAMAAFGAETTMHPSVGNVN